MKFLASSFVVLMSVVPIMGQTEESMKAALEVARATDNINNAIAEFKAGVKITRPNCAHPTGNYNQCITISEDIDDTQFIAHPFMFMRTLRELKGTADYNMGLGMINALRDATTGCVDDTELATFQWLSEIDHVTPVSVNAVVKKFNADVSFGHYYFGDITMWNTFADDHATGGVQVIYDFATATPGDDLEFPDFPMNMPPMEGGFYDIDFAANTITYTLKDNRSATNVVFPEGTFDRYYIIMPATVTSVEVVSSDSIVVEADILEDGTEVQTADFFDTGLVFPKSLGDNVIRVQIIGGTDLTELGQKIVLSYTLDQVMGDTFICASGPIHEVEIEVDAATSVFMTKSLP